MTVINQYLIISIPVIELNNYVQLFLSIIITKQSWNYLLDLLKSERIQRLNSQWADTLHDLFVTRHNTQHNKYLHHSHQLQFTLTTDITSSIFPTLHQPYHELTQLIDQCVKNNNIEQRWIPLTNWIQSKLNSNPPIVNTIEIKVMLLLNIYYNYYCNARLNSLDNLQTIIKNTLQPCDEEQLVFRAILQPEQHMIGYLTDNNPTDKNYLHDIFQIDYQDVQELAVRHTLVNLLAMILLSGKESPLWTFAFEPLKLETTYGFGSTATSPIMRNGVHYDCGCVLNANGELEQLHGGNEFSVPAIYIAYFATFGAMAWHLLLYESSVDNLYHPILAKHAVDPLEGMANKSIRAKTCAFVCTRLLSTKIFLSSLSNLDDACLLFNRCFELFAQCSRQQNQNPWIKPLYKTNNEKREAEKEFQNKIFYTTNQKLAEYKKIIDTVQSQSQPQSQLQNYISQMPIIIEMIHFKTELCSPESTLLPLRILRRLLDSFEFLKMTRYIYALSQFHVLLHRTFTQLIERDEFHIVTLKQLYERASQSSNRLRQLNQENKYDTIIKNGIEAVNAYHAFADGQIRPGACDITQRFETISMETPVSYLVETDNYDEGDIVMRILGVLVNYHNNLLELLASEINEYIDSLGLGPLNDIINELSEREISVLQIVQENMGIITLNKMDYQWIEQLSRASLENEKDYFLKLNTPLKFNFLYVQSYLIRIYLLYCRINYQHIKGTYQCYIQRKVPITTNHLTNDGDDNNTDRQSSILLIEEWNHLEQKNIDQLQNEYNFLQRIMDILENSTEDYSSMQLSEFVQNTNYDHRFAQKFEKYRMKDFLLSQIKQICQLYEQSINQFQHAFINVSHLLRVPLDKNLNDELDDSLKTSFIPSNEQIQKDKFQDKVHIIAEFLNDLKVQEKFFDMQWAQSFVDTCKALEINYEIVALIPKAIKCENYVPLCLKFIEIRSQLQERMIDIEEKTVNLWNARFDIPDTNQSQENSFQLFRNKDDTYLCFDQEQNSKLDNQAPTVSQPSTTTETTNTTVNLMDLLLIDIPLDIIEPLKPQAVQTQPSFEEPINYTLVCNLKIKPISLSPSTLFQNSQTQAEKLTLKGPSNRFIVTYLDDQQGKKTFCTPDKLYGQLKKIVTDKKYDPNTIAIIDPNEMLVDFMTANVNNILPRIEVEYRVVEKKLLIPIVLEFENNKLEYFVTEKATLTTILGRFIVDQQLKFTSPETYFSVFDTLGRHVTEDCCIDKIYRSTGQKSIQIQVVLCKQNTNICCEVTLTASQDGTPSQCFNPITTLKQMSLWLKILDINAESTIDSYSFWNAQQQQVINEDQTISSILGQAESITVDVLNGEDIIDVILSYDKNSKKIRILKSSPVDSLLKNPNYINQLGLKISPEDCCLVFLSNEPEKKSLEDSDMKNTISDYASMTNKPVHFQISTLVKITSYDNPDEKPIPIPHRDITIKQLLEIIGVNDAHTYLASCESKTVLSEKINLSMINDTKFCLAKKHETCLVSIQQPNDALVAVVEESMENQRYLINATMDDVYKQNKSISEGQYLSYKNDFVASRKTPLNLFLPSKNDTVEFILIYKKLPAHVTVSCDEQTNQIEFSCEPSMCLGRVHEIVCQLWKLKKAFSSLTLADDSDVDVKFKLEEVAESVDDVQLKLISIPPIVSNSESESVTPEAVWPQPSFQQTNTSASESKLMIKSIALSPSTLFQNSQTQAEKLTLKGPSNRFIVTYLDDQQGK
ncbi:unnamed protein product, partial [Rotaria sp. Silwood2]